MKRADEILNDAAETFRQRNSVYGDNWKQVGPIMAALFPGGVNLHDPDDYNRWHLFELMVVKLTRFANSRLTHQDSIHDIIVYGAMIEMLTTGRPILSPGDSNTTIWSAEDRRAIDDLTELTGLPEGAMLRAALKNYHLICSKLKEGTK